MRVTIHHSQKTTGLIFKSTHYLVRTTVEFTSDERETILERRLGSTVIMERTPGSDTRAYREAEDGGYGDRYDLKICDLTTESDVYACATPLDAKLYDEKLRSQLKLLKGYLDGNAEAVHGADTFEL